MIILVELNQITIKDANLLTSTDEFSEKFADCAILSLIGFFTAIFKFN